MSNILNIVIIFIAKDLVFVALIVAVWVFLKLSTLERKRMFVFAVIALPTTYLVAKLLSLVFYDPRPFVMGHFVPLISHNADNGFPSDHMLILSAVASVIYAFRKKIGWIFFMVAVMVGVARVLVGVHHAEDILGSLIIAIFCVYLVWKIIFPRFNERINHYNFSWMSKKK